MTSSETFKFTPFLFLAFCVLSCSATETVICLAPAGSTCIAKVSITQTHNTFPVHRATGKHPKPVWIANPYWDSYPMPGFWQCPIAYEQVADGSTVSASQHGEISGGSENHDKQPTCRLAGRRSESTEKPK